jgi:5-methylcytosine-specific restriction endonuclease McrA
MSSYVSAAVRRLVAVRTDFLCEYCLVHEDDTVFGCEVDHIISEKHGGATDAENLAYACAFCNRAKGSDIGSIVPRHRALRAVLQSTYRPLGRALYP